MSPEIPADTTVWLFNSVFEQQLDGTWLGWIEPLAGEPERVFEARGASPVEIRLGWFGEFDRIESEGGTAAWEAFREQHAKPVLAKDLPQIDWPPTAGTFRMLDALQD